MTVIVATKKPVTIQAMHFETNNDDGACISKIVNWIRGEALKKVTEANAGTPLPARHDGTCIYIATLEGEMRAQYGDYIIKGVNGEFYPCKPDIFSKTYETECDHVGDDAIYQKALDKWGVVSQIMMAMGECGEFSAEATKHFVQNKSSLEAVASEVADVEIMMGQMRLLCGKDLVDSIKKEKLNRLDLIIDGQVYHPHSAEKA